MTEKDILDTSIFWVFAAMSVFSALGVVFHRSIIYAALFLIVVFMSIAGFFVLNNADFLAIAQTIVYGVGLTIVLIFGVMFTGDKPFNEPISKSQRWSYNVVALMTCCIMLVGVVMVFAGRNRFVFPQWHALPSVDTINTLSSAGSTGMLGSLLFQKYVLPFEMASILLLVAMIGAIIIAKRTVGQEGDDLITGNTKFALNAESAVPAEAEALLNKEAAITAPPEAPAVAPATPPTDESPELAGVK